MDTKTPPIPVKSQEKKQYRKQEIVEDLSLPPLAQTSNGGRHRIHPDRKNPDTQWTNCPTPYVVKNCNHQSTRSYRVLHIGATPLMHACQQGERPRVLRLLTEQKDTINYRDRTLRNALHYCMDASTGGAVATAAPQLVNSPDAEGHTPLHLAVIAGDTQLVAVLLANGADVNAKDIEGHSILHWATVCGEAECVRLILAAGARPSTPDHRGGSPLHYAAQCCGAAVTSELSVPKKVGLRVLHTLLEFGADVNAKDEDGRQPILWAASAGSVEAVLALVRAEGSAAAGATDKDGLTALHCAASRGHARCVETLINLCGAQPDHVDDNGCSALHYAATLGHADATALLLRLGADPNRQDRKGRTPALCAAAKGQLETLKILAQHGSSLHARTVRGTGIAHEAVLSGRIELIEWLAKRKPRTLDVATHDGRTPLHVAALHGHLDICKVLLDHGCKINAIFRTIKSGTMTPLDAALYRGHRDCAKLIQMHGGITAHHVMSHGATPTRVFATKVKIKRNDSSSPNDSESGHRHHRKADVYIEEKWIKKRSHKHSSIPKKYETRRGSKSFSEEDFKRSTESYRNRQRRAKSESSRYDESGVESTTCIRRKYLKHEYSESSSETDNQSSELDESVERRRSNSQLAGDPSLSDDSLEVVVVKTSVEKKSEKVKYSDRKLKKKSRAPRRESKDGKDPTSQLKSKSEKLKSKPNRENKKKPRASGVEEMKKAESSSKNQKKDLDEKRKTDAMDSTSQGTVERVIVTAIVHKDQAPDTPIAAADSKGLTKSPPASMSKANMDYILAKTDEVQNALMARAADMKNGVKDIRRQLAEATTSCDDENDDKRSTPKGRRKGGDNNGNSADDQHSAVSPLQNQSEDRASRTSLSNEANDEQDKNHDNADDDDVDDEDDSLSKEHDQSQSEKSHRQEGTIDSNENARPHQVDKDNPTDKSVPVENKSVRRKASNTSPVKNSDSEDSRASGKSSRSSSGMKNQTGDPEVKQLDNENEEIHEGIPHSDKTKHEPSKADGKSSRISDEYGKASQATLSDATIQKLEEPGPCADTSGTPSKHLIGSKSPRSMGKSPDEFLLSISPIRPNPFESAEEHSPDRSAIVAVIEGPEWDEEDDQVAKEIQKAVGSHAGAETDAEAISDVAVLRVLPSTSDEGTPRALMKALRNPKTDTLPQVGKRIPGREELGERRKQRRDSGGRDSGIEPSPRVSKIPKRTLKCYPNTEKQQALNMETIQRDVQINLRRYHLERKIFFQLMELKRLQIRHGRVNEHILIKRQVDSFNKSGMSGPALGVVRYNQPLTFRHFESFLYEQLRRLQRRPVTPEWCTEAKQCTQKTHRCHHATSAYTSLPIYPYLDGGCREGKEEGSLLPRIDSRGKGQMMVKVTKGDEKQVIALPAEKLDCTKRYFITFTVKGEVENNTHLNTPHNAHRNLKSV